mgnify:CR=1 FL=1|jgi:hypothetical protein
MSVSAAARFHSKLKLIVAFALLWSFLMPTIDSVVTPVSSAIPAVSAGTNGCCAAGVVGKSPDKPEEKTPYMAVYILVFPLLLIVSSFRLRYFQAVPLLLRSLLLRPIKFTSNYVVSWA